MSTFLKTLLVAAVLPLAVYADAAPAPAEEDQAKPAAQTEHSAKPAPMQMAAAMPAGKMEEHMEKLTDAVKAEVKAFHELLKRTGDERHEAFEKLSEEAKMFVRKHRAKEMEEEKQMDKSLMGKK